MHAIRNKKNGKYVSGTDYRQHYATHSGIGQHAGIQLATYKQISNGSALTYADYWDVERDFDNCGCSPRLYKIVKVNLVEVDK